MFRASILPFVIALVYRMWSWTWRLTILEHPEFLNALKSGPVAFSHWHGDEMVVLCLGKRYKCAAMTSTSEDGELMTRVLRYFGFGIARGSSTRGGARALIGMIRLVESGYNASVAVDGPKGPRHKVKKGIFQVASHGSAKIIPTGVARKSAFVFEKSWNKTYLPLPFSKVVVSFGRPLEMTSSNLEGDLEQRMLLERGIAQAHLNKAAVM